ncbi:hypothetical protein TVAG_487990 [Trichomonas vaginalis G3]|uniref:Initiator binding domain-containing protein n=1 Tax=Trichomonas vaginalis (strain ATCC PRA-98 / G3) TaxID=412133 RepID=A2E6J2_TRIV3|nr:transcription-initiator DNA-binding domain ibd family [Trichomonas vaginalis G3]EAY11697.1 hypothetical protein TVAG_487990 [Trichomonas vaginalis G3]KAI5488867.1 transcription-initiator DNA-binding domain ibd family [Trichomonas vaginalis G3]|eukprot:XP_001323920.1 hypothetical protein [Trichomonas vaginalis G3]
MLADKEAPSPNENPIFFDLLSREDKRAYSTLRADLWSLENKFKRNKRLSSLQKSIDQIREFCIRNDSDDWKRCMVCGIVWLGDDIAINIRQLKLLVNKCKSSINGALLKMGFESSTAKNDGFKKLLDFMPSLRGNFSEQRMWTIRRMTPSNPVMFTPIPQHIEVPQFGFDPAFSQTPQPLLKLCPTQLYNKTVEVSQLFGTQNNEFVVKNEDPVKVKKEKKIVDGVEVVEDCCCCCPDHLNEEDFAFEEFNEFVYF